jgi:DNA repair protein RadA/Sms
MSFSTQKTNHRATGYAGEVTNKITKLIEVALTSEHRISTKLPEFDRVLGGGLIDGSVILIGGDPGIGKSTLLLQTLCQLSQDHNTLYVTGEESLQQVTLRAHRLDLPKTNLNLLAETNVEKILHAAKQANPKIIVIDSIQTIFTELLPSAPGSVSQLRESSAQLVQFAKQTNTTIFLVGHVTKEGNLAGPRVLEHMVDTVLYFEGESHQRYRILRAIKNRFGAVNELGVFAMTEQGLREINNPSAIFLSRYQTSIPGSAVMVTWEGSRPLLVEVQALVDQSYIANPKRVTVGLEQNRLAMLLAVLHRHGGVPTYDQDVFVNVVGGIRVTETAADLALQLAVLSSLRNRPLPKELICFGEVGLAGEIRPVQNGFERLKEAVKHGFKKAIVPKANLTKTGKFDLEIIPVEQLKEAIQYI